MKKVNFHGKFSFFLFLKKFFPIFLFFILALYSVGFAAQIRIAWDPNTESDLAGYKVYYGTSSRNYGSPIDVGNVTTYTIGNLTAGQIYYIAVTAYDTSNNESDYSNEVSGAATEGTQSYTVTTNPSGLQIVVDGTTYTAPYTFTWAVGSSHTISVSSPQSGTSGTRYVFASWSDEGAQSHTIIAPSTSTTYTANFTTQYSLTTSVSPSGGGSVSPAGTNWYASGQNVQLTATASSGYSFSGWSGDLTGSTNPATITMNGSKSVTANFVVLGTLSVTPTSGLSSSGAQGGPFSPSSQTYTLQNTGGTSISWTASKNANWITLSRTSGTLAAGASTTVTVSINNNANSLGAGSYSDTVSFVNSTNSRGNTTRTVSLTVNSQTQSYTVTTNPSGLQVVVDGTTYTAPQTFTWVVGSSHTISVNSPQSGANGVRYVYSSWSDGGAQSHTIIVPSSSTTYTANFTTQYSLTTSVTPSGGGSVSPAGTNWYNSGQSVQMTATASSGYTFSSWSGDLTGSTNPVTITMNGPKSVTAQFTAITESISTPTVSGPTSGYVDTAYSYIASGASSNLGHSLQYQFDWKGDGSDLSSWGAANQQKVWEYAGTYNVRVRARCSTHTSVVSNWSAPLTVTIQGDYGVSCGDGGIPCIERVDGGSDSNNLVNGKPKADVEFEFRATVYDAGGSPQYVKLFTAQRSDPSLSDFYDYDMNCSGNFVTGATCTYRTMLGPVSAHKFFIQVKMSNGTVVNYPSSGYITGPEVQLLNGNNLVGVPRNIANAHLDGQAAFGTTRVYRWNPNSNRYEKVTSANPLKEGEGYSLYKKSKTLPDFSNFPDVPDLEYIYPLQPGFNLISNPYPANVRLVDIKIQKGNTTAVSWSEAVARGWIADILYYFNGKDWGNTYSYFSSENGGMLVPWVSYWVDLEAKDDNYYLIIPKP